jgi:virulence factor Mce-like protein
MTNRLTAKVRRALSAAAAVAGVAVTSGCGFTVEKLPLPKPGASGETYTLHAVFANALNLPDQAKVKIGGSDVGVVSNIRTKNFQAIVDLTIRKDIELPTGSTAELRQATPLGDVFVSVIKPKTEPGTQILHEGDTISLDKTSAGATVEELLISVSMLFNGGGIAALSKLTSEMDSIVGGRGDQMAHLINEMTGVVGSLNANTTRVDNVLNEFSALATTIETRRSELGQVADTLPQMLGTVAENNRAIGDLLSKISVTSAALDDYSTNSGDQLGSLLDNVHKLMDALAKTEQNFGPALDALHEIKPGIDASFEGNSLAVYATLTNLDLSVLSDPAHGKIQGLRDVQDLAGSLITVLQLIQARVTGAYK